MKLSNTFHNTVSYLKSYSVNTHPDFKETECSFPCSQRPVTKLNQFNSGATRKTLSEFANCCYREVKGYLTNMSTYLQEFYLNEQEKKKVNLSL
jgi:hypothetical protein